jgi:hypothetical protein
MKSNSFRTEISCPATNPIALKDRILTTGSCFADQFGNWLMNNKFEVLVNPFGTNYNPLSIHKNLIDSTTLKIDDSLFIEQQDIWHHFDYHSQWSSQKQEDLINSIHKQHLLVNEYLSNRDILIITYGTAWVYQHKERNSVVANCHKVPAQHFEKRLLSVEEMVQSFNELYSQIRKIKTNIRVILTVSPVRHLKDTLQLNSVSKACLRLVCHELANQHKQVDYFPSFEIMLDDLRDYRFYERDKIHPTEEAVEYICQKFSDQYFTLETINFIETWTSIRQAVAHRPYHPDSAAHQQFLKDLLVRLRSITNVSVTEEINFVQSQIL